MSVSPSFFHENQTQNRTKRTFYLDNSPATNAYMYTGKLKFLSFSPDVVSARSIDPLCWINICQGLFTSLYSWLLNSKLLWHVNYVNTSISSLNPWFEIPVNSIQTELPFACQRLYYFNPDFQNPLIIRTNLLYLEWFKKLWFHCTIF